MDAITTIVLAQAAPAPSKSSGGPFSGGFFIPIILVCVIYYLLFIKPHRKKEIAQREMIKKSKAGDKILTSGGIYGVIVQVRDDVIVVEIAKGVKVDVTLNSIAMNLGDPKSSSDGDKKTD